MKSPAAPQPQVAKSSRRKRGCLITCIFLALLAAFYLVENLRGYSALRATILKYSSAGDSLELYFLERAETVAEKNFGSTPLLDGLMVEDLESSAAGAAWRRKTSLNDLLPPQRHASPHLSKWDPQKDVMKRSIQWGSIPLLLSPQYSVRARSQ